MAEIPLTESAEVTVADSAGVNRLKVNADGSTDGNLIAVNGASLTLDQKAMASSIPVVLPSDQYASPFNYATSEKLFSISYEWANVGTSEKNLMYILNPTGSGKNLVVMRIHFSNYDSVSSLTTLRVYANPTITVNGTALTIINRKIKTSPISSVMDAYYDPTTSDLGSLLTTGTTAGGAASGNSLILDIDGGIVLEPNNRLLLTGKADGTNRDTAVTVVWGEI